MPPQENGPISPQPVQFGPPSVQPAVPAPAGTPQGPVTGGKGPNKKRTLILAAVATGLVLLGGGAAAAYQAVIVPNKPQNLWKKAMANTGKGYDELSEYVKNVDSDDTKKLDVKGNFKFTGQVAGDGTITGSGDKNAQTSTTELHIAGGVYKLETKSFAAANSTYPDIYFKLDGIDALASLLGDDPATAAQIKAINNQWYLIDHSLYDQLAAGGDNPYGNLNKVTREDVVSVMDAVGKATKEYVFTSDEAKQVFVTREVVGKETSEDRNTYHYKVATDKSHLKAYVKALCKNLAESRLQALLPKDQKVEDVLECKNSDAEIDKADLSAPIDAWVDIKSKMLQKMRFTEKNKAGNYFDVIQNYTGGTTFPLSLAMQSKDDKTTTTGRINLSLNTDTDAIKLDGKVDQNGEKDQEMGGTFDLTITPTTKKIDIQKPAGAKPIAELIGGLQQQFKSNPVVQTLGAKTIRQ